MSSFLRNEEKEAKEYYPRYKILYAVMMISSLLLFGRLWQLQIIEGEELRKFSERNRVKETEIPAPRGLIMDREGFVLVDNLPGFVAAVTPQYATRLEDTAESLSEVFELDSDFIASEVKKSRYRNGPFFPVRIRDNLNLSEVFKLKLLRWEHPGLDVQEAILRHYPLKEKGAQLFGYVGEISRRQLKDLNNSSENYRYKQGDIIGKSGLELVWEKSLRGNAGLSFIEVDARGRILEAGPDTPGLFDFQTQEATPGNNLVLTLDKDIQLAAYEAMQRDDKVGPRVGGLVAMKSNGEILAWVNTPSFDPNQFSRGISSSLWSELINDPNKPLRNKIIQDHYPPGSTFKPIVALAALQEGAVSAKETIFAPSQMRFGRRIYHDASRAGHGNITLVEALERSSNIFFYKMGIRLGIDKIATYAKLLGLGSRTGIDLKNESPGLVPTREWKLKTFGEEWQPGENLSNSIGQGFVLTNALQMALAFNTIGLEGLMYRPFLVKKIVSHENKVIKEFEPDLIRDLTQKQGDSPYIKKEHFKVVKEGLRRVSNGTRGTARWWKVPGFEMAGKTGTSQVMSFSANQIYGKCLERPRRSRHHAWFVGYAPADAPEITVAVLAEHACAGSSGGAPVVRDVILAYMKKHYPDVVEKGEEELQRRWAAAARREKLDGQQDPESDEPTEEDLVE